MNHGDVPRREDRREEASSFPRSLTFSYDKISEQAPATLRAPLVRSPVNDEVDKVEVKQAREARRKKSREKYSC